MKTIPPLLLLSCVLLLPAARTYSTSALHKSSPIDPALEATLIRSSMAQTISVIVHLTGAECSTSNCLRQAAETTQAPLRDWLKTEKSVTNVTFFWIFNGLALTASPTLILELAERPEVARIELNQVIPAPPDRRPLSDSAPLEKNLTLIGVDKAWARGITGKGIVVALLDSGVDVTNPELAARWRGGSNSWFDPYGEHPEGPIDISGHGTQMLGVILGGEAGGSSIGVAPDAQWIAAKIFDDRGRATTAGIHQALQWALDPDGDPTTPDRPQVVNNSWSSTDTRCDFEFAEDLQALRAAGILPVFAAGTTVPLSPADLPEAFAVGALAEDGQTSYYDSAHGPSNCGGDAVVYPQVVAPGANILTTDRYGLTITTSGTSLAAAHVSGALALLLSANPDLTADEQAAVLTETAVDLGKLGADNEFGYGRINIAAALDRLLGPNPTAQATATAMTAPIPQSDDNFPVGSIASAGAAAILLVGLVVLWRRRRRFCWSGWWYYGSADSVQGHNE